MKWKPQGVFERCYTKKFLRIIHSAFYSNDSVPQLRRLST